MSRWAVCAPLVAGAAAVALLAATPLRPARADEGPYALADLDKALKELDKAFKGRSPEVPLEEFAKRALASLDVSDERKEIRAVLVKDFVPMVDKVMTKKGKVNDGSCRANVGKLLVALDDPKATGCCLGALEAYRGCEDLTRGVVDLLAKRAVEPDRDAAQRADLRKRLLAEFKETLDKSPSALALLIAAIRTLGGLEAVNLVADTTFKSAKKKSDLRGLEEVAKALGAWWEGQPHLEIRIPILLELAEIKPGPANPIDSVAIDGLEKFASREFDTAAQAKKWWTELGKRLKAAKPPKELNDSTVMIDSLGERKKQATEKKKLPDFKTDVSELIRQWNGPEFAWATPILLDILRWAEPEVAELRGQISGLLQQIRDPSAVPALLEIVAVDPDVTLRAFALQTVGFLAPENEAPLVLKLREILRGKEPALQLAAIETLGRIRGADALQETLSYGAGFAAGGLQSKAALVAAARIGNEAAEAALLKLLNDAPDNEKGFVIEALGRLPKLPFSDAVAGALGLIWSGAQTLRADKDAKNRGIGDGLITALVDAMLGGRNEGKGALSHRGLAHPTFLTPLKTVALSVEPTLESVARPLLKVLGESAPAKDIAPTMFEALNLPDKDERFGTALAWIEKHVDVAYRADYIALLKAKDKLIALRIKMATILGQAPAWELKDGYGAFLEVLEKEGREEKSVTLVQEILKQIRGHQCKHKMENLVALMEKGPKAQTDYLTMAVAGVLSAWLQAVMPNPPDLARDQRAWQPWVKNNLGKLELKEEECPK